MSLLDLFFLLNVLLIELLRIFWWISYVLVFKNNIDFLFNILQIVKNMIDVDFVEFICQQIWDNQIFFDYKYYGDFYYNFSY